MSIFSQLLKVIQVYINVLALLTQVSQHHQPMLARPQGTHCSSPIAVGYEELSE